MPFEAQDESALPAAFFWLRGDCLEWNLNPQPLKVYLVLQVGAEADCDEVWITLRTASLLRRASRRRSLHAE